MGAQCTIVMPVYNESACIAGVCRQWMDVVRALSSAELLVIDDGSLDGTSAILDELAALETRLIVVHQENSGHGAAIRRGYRLAIHRGAEWIFQTDSDGEISAADFWRLWPDRRQSRFVLGARQNRQDAPVRRLLSRIHRAILRVLFGVKLQDPNVGFRLMASSFLALLLEQVPDRVFAPNVFLAILARSCAEDLHEVPVNHMPRSSGKGSIRLCRLPFLVWRCLRELLAFRLSFSRRRCASRASLA